jgi:PKD repeat protein
VFSRGRSFLASFCLLFILSRAEGQTPPNASFTTSLDIGAAPLVVQFTDGSTGNIISWKWNFDDGSAPATVENPVHTFTNIGVFSVTLTVMDDASFSNTTTQAVEVLANPPNDDFSHRAVLKNMTNTATGWNFGASMEPGEPPNGGVAGGHSVWWTWRAPVSGILNVSTAGSDFDTTLGVYEGSCVSNLSLVAFNDDADPGNGVLTSFLSFDVESNQTYQICVDGVAADTTFGATGLIDLSVGFNLRTPAPAWTAVDLATNSVESGRFAGRVVVLDFWATTCDACSQEIPVLVQLQSKYGSDGLTVIGVSQDPGSSDDIYAYASNAAINYLVIRSNPALEQEFGGITSLPTIFVIDRDNGIAAPVFNTVTSLASLESVIVPLLYEHFTINASRTGTNNLVVSWPVTGATPVLETTSDPLSGVWTGVNAQIVLQPNRTRAAVVHAANAEAQFFRVRLEPGD